MRRTASILCALALAALAGCSGDQITPPTPSPSTTSPTTAPSSPPATALSPLTGLPLDADRADRQAIAVKIDNVGPARPQAGVHRADLVIEEPVESGLTRLMAVFHSRDADRVGPVRSARVSDASLMRALGGGVLAFSGASSSQLRVVRRESGATLVTESRSDAWSRDRSRPVPHNLFLSVARLRAGLDNAMPPPVAQFTFTEGDATGMPTRSARLRWGSASAGWTWDAGSGMWLRTQNGTRHVVEGGRQLAARNVVILQVRIRFDARFHDRSGNRTPLPDLVGGGRAWVLRDGLRIAARWRRTTTDAPFTLDGEGDAVTLAPGVTWIELLSRPGTPTFS